VALSSKEIRSVALGLRLNEQLARMVYTRSEAIFGLGIEILQGAFTNHVR